MTTTQSSVLRRASTRGRRTGMRRRQRERCQDPFNHPRCPQSSPQSLRLRRGLHVREVSGRAVLMAANPTTDQYLAEMRDQADPTLDESPFTRDLADVLCLALPDLAPAIVGEVMLHAGIHLAAAVAGGGGTARGAAVLLATAGRRLVAEGRDDG